jgi:membrane-bound metal-dependent hydrolase YbcI (DUF457 family)
MDTISHILMGKAISIPEKSRKSTFWTIFFSLLPDLSLVPFFIYLGYINKRMFFIPHNSDWEGIRNLYPVLNSIQEIGHSFLFAFLIILPIIILFKLPKIAFGGYLLHLFVDLPTHTGEWAVKPFYPFNYSVEGFTDAWSWPLYAMVISWIILSIAIVILNRFYKKPV